MYFVPGMNQGPRIERPLRLDFGGDWGHANFHRVCGWLCQEMSERAGPGSDIAIHNGSGGFNAMRRVADGTLDFAIATPASFARMAVDGRGPFAGAPLPTLRSVGVLPQRDRLVMAIDPRLGIHSYAELRARAPALRIACSSNDGDNLIGYATAAMMEASGISPGQIAQWGGTCVYYPRPDQCIALARAGEVDAVIQEAIMTPWWRDLVAERGMVLLPLEPSAQDRLRALYGWEGATIERGYFAGLGADVAALDFSDFVLMVNADMPDDVAHLLTWCLCETRMALERHYHQFPPDRSPLGYPLDPARMAATPIALHPGARRYYTQAGALAG